MKTVLPKLIAVILLVIPGLLATYGFLLVKNALFDALGNEPLPWLRLLLGLLLFAGGVGFIGGWIFNRDRKRNYVSPRFREKKMRRPRN